MRLSDFSTLTFDCYGTLIDWESGIFQALGRGSSGQGRPRARPHPGSLRADRMAQQAATPTLRYSELLVEVHRGLAERVDIAPDPAAAKAFGASVKDWPAFPDFWARRSPI